MPQILTEPQTVKFALSEGSMPRNRKRWTRDDCNFLERSGLLEGRYELLDGEIISKMGQNQPHAITVTLLLKWLIAVFGGDFVIGQLPIEIAVSDRQTNKPEPDASVLREPVTHYLRSAPGPGDVRLVAEVSDSTLRDDLRTKAFLYARSGIPEYWVLDVISRRLFVHRAPHEGQYGEITVYTENETVSPEAAPDAMATISELLPPVLPEGENE